MCHILAFPAEIFETILDGVEDTPDLFSLALTCKTVYPQVVPFHSDWRVIDLPLGIPFLPYWRSLLSQPLCLRHVRTLIISASTYTGHHKIRIPRPLAPETLADAGSMETMVDTLMEIFGATTGLTRLRLSSISGLELKDNFWHSISSVPCLELQEIPNPNRPELSFSNTICSLPLLRQFEYRTCIVPDGVGGGSLNFHRIARSIYGATNLVSLTLVVSGGSRFVPDEFLVARWPNLKKLHLSPLSGDPDVATAFLYAHPTIEDLSLTNATRNHLFIFPSTSKPILPRLRRFVGSVSHLVAVLGDIDTVDICPLEDIRLTHSIPSECGIPVRGDLVPSQLILHLRRITTLVRFQDSGGLGLSDPRYFSLLVNAIRQVESLFLPELIFKIQRRDELKSHQASWMHGFTFLPNLKVFHTGTYSNMGGRGVSFGFASRVAEMCGSLTFVGDRHLGGWWITGREGGITMMEAILSERGIPTQIDAIRISSGTGLNVVEFTEGGSRPRENLSKEDSGKWIGITGPLDLSYFPTMGLSVV
ncbi:hypothetical protein B0H19DRAFT_1080529 [Mycena capillaripes]|nr:hypothetical protein B0H19DRAFT_1080529 [Mycena capillaripes]